MIGEERKEAQEKAARLAEELLQAQTRIDDLREKVGTLTFEASKPIFADAHRPTNGRDKGLSLAFGSVAA